MIVTNVAIHAFEIQFETVLYISLYFLSTRISSVNYFFFIIAARFCKLTTIVHF